MVAEREDAPAGPLRAARDAFDEGRPSLTIELLRSVAADPDGDPQARLLLARAYDAVERQAEAEPILAGLVADPRLAPEDRPLALALAAHGVVVSHDPARGRAMAREALAASRATDSAAAIAELALARSLMYDGDLPAATRTIQRAARTAIDATADERAVLAAQEAFLLLQQDRFEEAERAAERGRDAIPAPTPRMLAILRHARGATRFHAGAWADVEALLDPRPVVADGADLGEEIAANMASLLSVVLVHRDRLAEAGDLLRRAVPALVTGQRPFLLWASMLVADASGDVRATRELADRLIASFGLLGSPGGLRIYGVDLVRVLIGSGDRARAAELTAVLETRVAPSGTPSVTASALLLRGMVESDAGRLRRAADMFRAAGRPLELAISLERLGRVLAVTDRVAAIAAYRSALATYERLGATRDERLVSAALRSMGAATGRRGRRSTELVGWPALSRSEQAVARLVADGLTNAEIGRRLTISPRTVESHVAHALAKLGVRNRTELAAAVARAADPA